MQYLTILEFAAFFPRADYGDLLVENVPEDIYNALRNRARANRKSIAAEVISLLQQNIPTAAELKRRQEFYDRLAESGPSLL